MYFVFRQASSVSLTGHNEGGDQIQHEDLEFLYGKIKRIDRLDVVATVIDLVIPILSLLQGAVCEV